MKWEIISVRKILLKDEYNKVVEVSLSTIKNFRKPNDMIYSNLSPKQKIHSHLISKVLKLRKDDEVWMDRKLFV